MTVSSGHVYHKVERVPMWFVVGDTKHQEKVVKWLEEAEALHREWPSIYFKPACMALKGRYKSMFAAEPVVFTKDFIVRAATDAVRMISSRSTLNLNLPITRISKIVKDDSDYTRIFDEILKLLQPIALSQMFQIGEHTIGARRGENRMAFYTVGNCNKELLTWMADRVITIGDGESYTIDLSDVKANQVKKTLENSMN